MTIEIITGAFGIPKIKCRKDEIPAKGSSPTPAQCGEDSYFIKETDKVVGLGVADGISEFRERGIDPGNFARALMSHSSELIESGLDFEDTGNILRMAFYRTVDDFVVKGLKTAGGSTAIVAVIDKEKSTIKYGNLGDSSCMIFSPNEETGKYFISHKSKILQKDFNCPYQLALFSKNLVKFFDQCSFMENQDLPVKAGDVVLLMSDGVVDNVFEEELENYVTKCLKESITDLKALAEYISFQAFEFSNDKVRKGPFSAYVKDWMSKEEDGSEAEPYEDEITGKPDDITVVAAIIQ